MSDSSPAPPGEAGPVVAPEPGARGVLSVVFVVLAALVALVGGVAFYVREELVDAPTFANRTVDALHSPWSNGWWPRRSRSS